MTGIVIRTLNESQHLGECLDVLARQHGDHELDIVVVDSGSTDSTVEIARSRGARIVELAPDEFDYSRALNVGIGEAAGEVVFSLSAHAIPVDERWLDRMLAPFADPDVAGVSCRQVPWPGAQWHEVHRLRHQFPPHGYTVGSDLAKPIVFSNAASALRRSVWSQHPFTLPAVEDLDWAQRVIAAGWRIAYEADAAVFHSHEESPRAQALRMIDINRVLDPNAEERGRLRTVREAAGILIRDTRKIISLDDPVRRKTGYLVDLVKMVSYYVLDFSRAGTTAERRREGLGPLR
jgi:GT2 family glycosyltransferase